MKQSEFNLYRCVLRNRYRTTLPIRIKKMLSKVTVYMILLDICLIKFCR